MEIETNLPKSGDAIDADKSARITFDPNSIFKNKNISYFDRGENNIIKIQYQEFTQASGERKWINVAIVVAVFLLINIIIIISYPPARNFLISLFK